MKFHSSIISIFKCENSNTEHQKKLIGTILCEWPVPLLSYYPENPCWALNIVLHFLESRDPYSQFSLIYENVSSMISIFKCETSNTGHRKKFISLFLREDPCHCCHVMRPFFPFNQGLMMKY